MLPPDLLSQEIWDPCRGLHTVLACSHTHALVALEPSTWEGDLSSGPLSTEPSGWSAVGPSQVGAAAALPGGETAWRPLSPSLLLLGGIGGLCGSSESLSSSISGREGPAS